MKTCVCTLVLVGFFASSASAASADYFVNSTRDALDASPGDRVCSTGTVLPDGSLECTLRAALQEANVPRAVFVLHHIHMPAGVFTLTIADVTSEVEDRNQLSSFWDTATAVQTGDLDIEASVEILGAGAGMTIIDGGDHDRVFDIWSNGRTVDVTLQNLTIRNGTSTAQGGCINNRQRAGVWMFSTVIEDCVASNQIGGGMYNNGTVVMARVVFRNNQAIRGGALENGYIAQIDESTFDNNRAVPGLGFEGKGGAISNLANFGEAPSLLLKNSTLSNNRADVGGALFNQGATTFLNSTVSGNRARRGGAVSLFEAVASGESNLWLVMSTVTNNITEQSGFAAISNQDGRPLHVRETIIANNRNATHTAITNCNGGVTESLESLEDANTCGLSSAGSLVNTDPLLGPLADNSGPTLTHALLAGSPAIDFTGSPMERRDQRGFPRPMFGAGDIGAYEKGFEFIFLIPLDWTAIFDGIFTMSDTSFRVDLSLVTPGKSSADIAEARIIGVKAANGQTKFELAKDGKSISASGVFTPPKDQSNSTLFYLEVQPGVQKAAQLRVVNASCKCDAKPRKNPSPIIIPSAEKIEKK